MKQWPTHLANILPHNNYKRKYKSSKCEAPLPTKNHFSKFEFTTSSSCILQSYHATFAAATTAVANSLFVLDAVATFLLRRSAHARRFCLFPEVNWLTWDFAAAARAAMSSRPASSWSRLSLTFAIISNRRFLRARDCSS